MSNGRRIFVVESDEGLNQNIVNLLRQDGYAVQSVTNGADAVRLLWSTEFDVVISDTKTPGITGLDLLQWLRAYRPETRAVLIDGGDPSFTKSQALENGAASFLEKPLDPRLLREELQRLFQQTGFSANLDSFDLLDIAQMMNMGRRSIALLVNTGLEERGMLRFQNGELIWAEYGVLRGEEAFFALAAHKNGSVTEQRWTEPVTPNVKQPLSRLVFQALQYRTKYANMQSYIGEQDVDTFMNLSSEEEDDTPFAVLEEDVPPSIAQASPIQGSLAGINGSSEAASDGAKHSDAWWEEATNIPTLKEGSFDALLSASQSGISSASAAALDGLAQLREIANGVPNTSDARKSSPHSGASDAPWFIEQQPTSASLPNPSLSQPLVPPKGRSVTANLQHSSPGWPMSPSLNEPEMPAPPSAPFSSSSGIHALPDWSNPSPASKPDLPKQASPVQPSVPQVAFPKEGRLNRGSGVHWSPATPVNKVDSLSQTQMTGSQIAFPLDVDGTQGHIPAWQQTAKVSKPKPIPSEQSGPQIGFPIDGAGTRQRPRENWSATPANKPEPLSPTQVTGSQVSFPLDSGVFRAVTPTRKSQEQPRTISGTIPTQGPHAASSSTQRASGEFAPFNGIQNTGMTGELRRLSSQGYNYPALVSALQTLGYAINGFVAAAIVNMSGQPIAQVAVDDIDISNACRPCSTILQQVLGSFQGQEWRDFNDMVISFQGRCILMRVISGEKNIFHVLVTTQEADPAECLEIMTNVEGALEAALR